ncbi:MAG: OmpH family outer membrane protein, partial [Hallella sp.]|nr:OmpH family outer membrane protein [Hallella sp.]
KYVNEMKRVEQEFNQKYEMFLDGQRDFAPSIRHKRQAELQELMEKNMAFKEEAKRLLKEAEGNIYKPLRDKLTAALQRVAKEKGLAFILNTDNDAVPFIDPTTGFNVQADVNAALQ